MSIPRESAIMSLISFDIYVQKIQRKRGGDMNPILYELLWFFFLYAFAGWIIGTAAAAVREKKFVDVGFLYGPV